MFLESVSVLRLQSWHVSWPQTSTTKQLTAFWQFGHKPPMSGRLSDLTESVEQTQMHVMVVTDVLEDNSTDVQSIVVSTGWYIRTCMYQTTCISYISKLKYLRFRHKVIKCIIMYWYVYYKSKTFGRQNLQRLDCTVSPARTVRWIACDSQHRVTVIIHQATSTRLT